MTALRAVSAFLLAFLFAFIATSAVAASGRRTISLDSDWRFLQADAAGAEKADFDDSAWRKLSVPHDWSIEGRFDADAATTGAGGFLPAGVGWYRRTLPNLALASGARVFLEFDGVMANSDVWINGGHLGHRPNGYVGFRYELTSQIHSDRRPNLLAVRVDDSAQPASRWYAGAGIYRHVRLIVTDAVHLDTTSTVVTTPTVSREKATVHVATAVLNQASQAQTERLLFVVSTASGVEVGRRLLSAATVPAGKTLPATADIDILRPALWDVEHPVLYRCSVQLLEAGDRRIRDDEDIAFGIRDAHFEAASGFWLNGVNLKLKGVCLHGDAGALGVAVPLSVWERRLRALKSVGCNAIRTTHCPPAPEFLDLCDRMGFLVMDEMFDCWTVGKERFDYHVFFNDWSSIDCADAVRRDRNHPSVVLYSVGNEIRDTPQAASAKATLARLVAVCHENDPTRPVTQALFRPNASHDYDDGLADQLDVVGQNYREAELAAAHVAKPSRKIVGTENGHDRRAWLAVRDNPAYSGQFLWTGFDYLGESKAWPVVGSSSGLFDRTGEPRSIAWERASWWSDAPVVHLVRRLAASRATPDDPGFTPLAERQTAVADWSPLNRAPHNETVEVYSNAANVELWLNGKSLGAKALPADASPRSWSVPFEPGALRAVATDAAGKEVGHDELRTAGPAARVLLTTDTVTLGHGWDEVAFVRATIVDAAGVEVPDAVADIDFAASGGGSIVATDNGDNASHESFQVTHRKLYHGHCLAIVRAVGGAAAIDVTATASGLAAGHAEIKVDK